MEQLKITVKTINLQKKHILQMPYATLTVMEKGIWLCWVRTDKGDYFIIEFAEKYYILRREDWKAETLPGDARAYFTSIRGTAHRTFTTEEERDRWLKQYKHVAPQVEQVYI